MSSQGSLERVWGFVLFWGKFFFRVLGNVNVFNVKLEDKQSNDLTLSHIFSFSYLMSNLITTNAPARSHTHTSNVRDHLYTITTLLLIKGKKKPITLDDV